MAIYTNGCNNSTDDPKILKFEGNNLVITQGSGYVFNSSDISTRFWFEEVDEWLSSTKSIAPTETHELEYDFDCFALLINKQPETENIDPVPVLVFTVNLYLEGNTTTTPDNILNINDFVLIDFGNLYSKIEIVNNSTNTTEEFKYTILLCKKKGE